MPIRINLKELFPADAQEITIDKINFNFNKLLALGIGEPGPLGLTGIQGSAGPVGGTGSQGVRGSTWIVDAGAPTITTGLLDGDLYLDSTALAVWQWDAATSTWNFLFDISAIVQNYLNSVSSPFVRGFGAGSPNDQRFILFGNRDNPNDSVNNSASTNDVLFLSNYDDATLLPNPPSLGGSPDTTDFYDALLSISVDQRSGGPTRSHIELGAVYNSSNPTLTSLDENFKIRYDRFVGSSIHPYANPADNRYNRLTFSLDVYDSLVSTNRDFSSVFAFQSPKYVSTDPTNTFSSVFIGSRYGLDEEAPSATSGSTLADGIVFATSGSGANIGVAVNYVVPGDIQGRNTGYINNVLSPSQDYFMLDSLGSTDALFLNDKVYQNGGNIVQLGTTAARLTGSGELGSLSSTDIRFAMAQQGNKIFTIIGSKTVTNVASGSSKNSQYNETVIENPNFPKFHITSAYTAASNLSLGSIDFAGISDVAVSGDYLYCVKNLSLASTTGSPRIVVQAVRTSESSDDQLPSRAGYLYLENLGLFSLFLESAHKIKLRGNLAVITTNGLAHNPTVSGFGGGVSDGRVTLVDITCPDDLRLVNSVVTTKTAGLSPSAKAAIMDMDVVDDWVYALTWEQDPSGPNAKVNVKIDLFSIEEADTEPATNVTWKTAAANTFISNTFIPGDYANLSKVGAITANKKYIYAGYCAGSAYPAIFRTYELRGGNAQAVLGPYQLANPMKISLVSSLTLTIPGVQISEINRIQQLGTSAYVLVNTVSNGCYIVKVDVSNPTSMFQVWYTQVRVAGEYCDNFILHGKHIYVAKNSTAIGVGGTPNSNIKAFEIDGFYTGAAHIESLRTDEFNVTQNANIGNTAIINNELNVGGRAEITGELGVGTRLRLCGGSYFTGESGDIVANIINSTGSLTIRNTTSTDPSTLRLVNGPTNYFELTSLPSSGLVQMNLDSSVDLEINTTSNKKVKIKSTGQTILTLETNGGGFNNIISLYDGLSSIPANEALRISTIPNYTNASITAKNSRDLRLIANSTANNQVIVEDRLQVIDWVRPRKYHVLEEFSPVTPPSGIVGEYTPGVYTAGANNVYASGSSWGILQVGTNENIIHSGVADYVGIGTGTGVNFGTIRNISSDPTVIIPSFSVIHANQINWASCVINWQRVGQIVSCTFYLSTAKGWPDNPGSDLDQILIPLPVITTRTLSALAGSPDSLLHGSGTMYNDGGGTNNPYAMLPVEIKGTSQGPCAIISFTRYSASDRPIRGSFSYALSIN